VGAGEEEMSRSADGPIVSDRSEKKPLGQRRKCAACGGVVSLAALFWLGFPAIAGAQTVSESANPFGTRVQEYGNNSYVPPDTVYVPPSSIVRPEDAGKFAHTDYVIANPNREPVPSGTKKPDPTSENPGSLACVYGLLKYGGCTPQGGAGKHIPTKNGGWGAIALVDAFDNPDAGSDYILFSKQYHLPTTGFTQAYANSTHVMGASCSGTPPPNQDWAVEESLDIEYAHAMAPAAQIILVEACTNSVSDLVAAEDYATTLVTAAGGGDISNSWGAGEFSGQIADDVSFYAHPHDLSIVYFASAGDSGCGAQWPSSSPWVVSAGGTTINRDSKHRFVSESCWTGSGGGTSTEETYATTFSGGNTGPWADFQYAIFGQAARATPDFAFDADPTSGVNIISQFGVGSTTEPWITIGGTSVASPALAGLVNLAGNKLGSNSTVGLTGGFYNSQENNLLYSQLPMATYSKNFFDVTTGSNGCTVGAGWDYCAGVGSPRGLIGK
jgi:kumamolisin